jgi:hypothetical protein
MPLQNVQYKPSGAFASATVGLDSEYNSSQDMYEETGSDNNGNLRMEKLAHTAGTPFSVERLYRYDPVNRLGSFSEPSKSQSCGYDAFGNIWQTGATGVPAHLSPKCQFRLSL